MKLVMTLLVRDEIDIVEHNIAYHLAAGVDHIIATDNGSVDGTRDVLAEYQRKGMLTLLDEPGRDFSQARWVTRMALLAIHRFSAQWVLNNDADEFWVHPKGDLHEAIDVGADVLKCRRFHLFYAHDREDSGPWQARVRYRSSDPEPRATLNDPLNDALPSPFLTLRATPKALLRTGGLLAVGQGNHRADYDKAIVSDWADIRILHFPVRSARQFETKVLQGGEAYRRNRELPLQVGWHWRRWHQKLRKDGLESALRDVLPSQNWLSQGLASGAVVTDDRLIERQRSADARRSAFAEKHGPMDDGAQHFPATIFG